MMLQQRHIDALTKAEPMVTQENFGPYLQLKTLLPNSATSAQQAFRLLFTRYYGLNAGGLTQAFKDKYFDILHSGKVFKNQNPRYVSILCLLHKIPRKKGDKAMPFSFVSKLVGIHQERNPIYDKHVLAFFGEGPPSAKTPRKDRIDWYVRFLNSVASDYRAWAQDQRVIPLLAQLRAKDPRLANCHEVRLLDFLVWKVGNKKLL